MNQYCMDCGAENLDNAQFCKECGKKLFQTQNVGSVEKHNFGSKLLKYIAAIIVSIVILMIASVIFQLFKHGLDDVGQNIYHNYGGIGTFFFAMFQLLPLMIGIWLIKLSWKKITADKG